MKKDKRWRYSPSDEDEQWLADRTDATDRTEGDIIYELVQKGKRAFDRRYQLGEHAPQLKGRYD